MKINLYRLALKKNRKRFGVVITVLFLMIVALPAATAQFKGAKRITSMQVGDAAEGSRVTVVSDSALNDYEAFRRGDRFYVKIPVANYNSAEPRLRGDGFDGVQVQQVGDGVMVSFKLQPGASARVDQRSNRLDVIFSAPNKTASNLASNYGSRGTSGWTSATGRGSSSSLRNRAGTVGPMPPDSPWSASGQPVVSSVDESRTVGPRSQNKKVGSSAATLNQPAASPSLAVPSPSTSAGYARSIGTPAPAGKTSVTASGSSRWANLKDRARQWVAANRRLSLLGGVLLLVLLAAALVALLRRRKKVIEAKRTKGPLAQPKFSHDIDLGESKVASSLATELSSSPNQVEKAAVVGGESSPFQAAPANGSRSVVSEQKEPVVAASASVTRDYSRVLTSPSIVSSKTERGGATSEEEEREVFEL